MTGEFEFTLPRDAYVATYPPGATFGPRQLADFEFVWMIEGDAIYRRGDKCFEAPQGSVVLCRPGAVDSFEWDKNRRTRHGYFHWQITAVPHHWPPPARWPVVRAPREANILWPLLGHILAWSRDEHAEQLHLSVAYLLTVYVSGETATASSMREAWPEPVERVWTFIQRRMDEDALRGISLDEMAQVACVSSEHLCRLFKVSTGHSPVETVRLARLDRAVQLLARTNYSVAEVARLCGFASQFHFSRVFRVTYGQSPREMRAAIQRGESLPISRLVSPL